VDGTGHGGRVHDGVEQRDLLPAERSAAPKQVVGREANAGEMEYMTFWEALDRLVACHSIRIDRRRGTVQPSDPGLVYPMDYGYLEGTVSGDGEGIDVWIGSLGSSLVTGVLCTVDTNKEDAEIKLLVGCAPDEAKRALEVHNRGLQSAILVERPSQGSQSPCSPPRILVTQSPFPMGLRRDDCSSSGREVSPRPASGWSPVRNG